MIKKSNPDYSNLATRNLWLSQRYAARADWKHAYRCAYRSYRLLPPKEAHKLAKAATAVGLASWFLKGPGAALPWYKRAIEQHAALAGSQVPKRERLQALEGYGLCLFHNGQLEAALEVQTKAVAIPDQEAAVTRGLYRQLSNTALELGRYSRAEDYHQHARPDAEATPLEAIKWFNSAAILAEKQGHLRKADALWKQALAAAGSLTLPELGGIAAIISNAALLKLDLDRPDEAEELMQRFSDLEKTSMPLSAKLGHKRLRATIADYHGDLDSCAAEWSEAFELVLASAPNDINLLIQIRQMEARTAAKSRHWGNAKRLLSELLDAQPLETLPPAAWYAVIQQIDYELTTSECASISDSVWSKAWYILEAEIRRQDAAGLVHLFYLFAQLASASQNTFAAVFFGKIALKHISRMRAAANLSMFPADNRNVVGDNHIPDLVQRLASLGRISEATRILDIKRQFTQADLFTGTLRDGIRQLYDVPLNETEQQFETQIEALLHHPPQTVNQATELFKNILQHCEEAPPKQLMEIDQPQLDENELKVAYIFDQAEVFAQVHNAQGSFHYKINRTGADLALDIMKFQQILRQPGLDPQPMAATLFDLLLGPISDLLINAKHLILKTDGPIGLVPFACLIMDDRYLCEHVSLRHQASGKSNCNLPQPKLRAFGTSNGFDQFGNLPNIARELADVASYFSDASITLDADFTSEKLQQVLEDGTDYLHIASHFYFSPGFSKQSFLLLGDGSRLYITELLSDRFNFSDVTCITLSACDTAASDNLGNGMESISSACLAKGAGSFVGSLWPIDDEATKNFMNDFYEAMIGQSMPVFTALQQAQIAMIKPGQTHETSTTHRGGIGSLPSSHHASPFFWAGFICFV